jgi:outer membrane protein assembly factor BamD (BamD/ComL family)
LTVRQHVAYFSALIGLWAVVRARCEHIGNLVMRQSTRPLILQFAICNLQFAILFSALVSATPTCVRADWPWSGWFSDPPPVGTADWWKKNKNRAELEVGKGWKVPGIDGYFDQDGRPMNGPVSSERVVRATVESTKQSDEGLIPGLDPKVQYDRLKTAVGLGPNEQLARDAYTRGLTAFGAGEYGDAADEFAEAADRGRYAQFQQDAMYMLAESYFFDDRYIKARDAYDALIAKYSNTRYLDTVIEREWNIARYWEKYEDYNPDWALTANAIDKTRPWFDTIGHAIKTYDNIRLNDPTGPRADDAIMATANIYFRRGRYDDADYHYTLLRREYPRSELQFEAHLLGLQAKMRKYQGPDYDSAPMEEAQKLVKQIRRQFAGRLKPEEQERLNVTEAELRHQIAMADFRMGEYYDGIQYYAAAQIYYTRVAQQYPETDLAAQARTRLAEIKDEPAEPPKRLAWFVELFPQSKEKARLAKIPEIQQGKTRLAQALGNEAGPSGVSPASGTTAR